MAERVASGEGAIGAVAADKEVRLTTRGRVSGQPRSVTIWFVADGDALGIGTLGADRNWVKNARANPDVELAFASGTRLVGTFREVAPDSADHSRIRRLMAAKYLPFRIAGWLGIGQRFTFRVEDLRPPLEGGDWAIPDPSTGDDTQDRNPSGSTRRTFDDLCEDLVSVVQESHRWAAANDFPAVADYPRYEAIRSLGVQIHEVAGFPGMQEACRILKSRCHTRDGGGKSWPAEKAWEGIGGWLP